MDPTARESPAARLARRADVVSGATLLLLAALKLPLLQVPAAPGTAIAIGFFELALGLLLILGWRPGIAAGGLVTIGLATTMWTALKLVGIVQTGPCGCFGLHRPSNVLHALVASALLFLGGMQTYLLSARPR